MPIATLRPTPFVKWAGGKTQLLPALLPLIPSSIATYFEPFVGGGAVFFAVAPDRAVIGDVNAELANCYRMVRDDVTALMAAIDAHRYQRDYFYALRRVVPATLSPIERAARFIYLNKSCFNGLWRVNRKGEFNVPFGSYRSPRRFYDRDNLIAASEALRSAEIVAAGFDHTLAQAGPNDFVYLDPPYQPVGASSFTRYTVDDFVQYDQQWLQAQLIRLTERGCRVLLSNSDTPFTRWLYADFTITEVQAIRAINSDGNGRGTVTELLIRNYDP